MIETFVQKGEAVVVHSDVSFDVRQRNIRSQLVLYPEITVYAKDKILMEDVRDFTYEIQKEGTHEIFGVQKIGILICDEIAPAAQHALLKVLEDMRSDACIIIYAHEHSVFLSTVLSRVIVKHEVTEDTKNESEAKDAKKKVKKDFNSSTVVERFDLIKTIMKEYDDEEISKQDITTFVESVREGDKKKDMHSDVYARALSMLKQPSVSIKYVLEYVAGSI